MQYFIYNLAHCTTVRDSIYYTQYSKVYIIDAWYVIFSPSSLLSDSWLIFHFLKSFLHLCQLLSYFFHILPPLLCCAENAIDCGSFIDDLSDIELWQLADFLLDIKSCDDVRTHCRYLVYVIYAVDPLIILQCQQCTVSPMFQCIFVDLELSTLS